MFVLLISVHKTKHTNKNIDMNMKTTLQHLRLLVIWAIATAFPFIAAANEQVLDDADPVHGAMNAIKRVPLAAYALAVCLVFYLFTKRGACKRQGYPKNVPPGKMRVHGFLPLGPDPDCSPPCTKLLTFLKMTKTDFEFVPYEEHEMKDAPKGKMPFVLCSELSEDYKGDSLLIMDALVRKNPVQYDLDSHLTAEQHAVGKAFCAMLEESFYFLGVHHVRWNTAEFDRYTGPLYFSSVPSFLRGIVMKQCRTKMLRDLKGQGTRLLNDDEVIIKANQEIMAVSDFLGSKKYFLGDRVSSYDASIYAHLAGAIQGDWQHPICETVRGCENIVNYVQRMRDEFWPELQSE